MIGPSLPPHLITARSTDKSTTLDDDSQDAVDIDCIDSVTRLYNLCCGPQLPSTNSSSKASYGPSLPPGMTYGSSIPEDSKDISVYFVSKK